MLGKLHCFSKKKSKKKNISKNDICLLGVRVEKRCDGTVKVGFSVNPLESENALRVTFDELESCFFGSILQFAGMWNVNSAGMSWKFYAEKR